MLPRKWKLLNRDGGREKPAFALHFGIRGGFFSYCNHLCRSKKRPRRRGERSVEDANTDEPRIHKHRRLLNGCRHSEWFYRQTETTPCTAHGMHNEGVNIPRILFTLETLPYLGFGRTALEFAFTGRNPLREGLLHCVTNSIT